MEFKYEIQQYQTDAVNSIVRIFDGSVKKSSLFTIDISKSSTKEERLDLQGEDISYLKGYSNKLTITNVELMENVRKIQLENGIMRSTNLYDRNFTIEMETGTGKTYVYTKTILELNKQYGLTKFIIVVPSIAIKEGVYKSFQNTESHFKAHYENVVYHYFVYDSNRLNDVQAFATSSNIEIMIINIDSFKKSFDDPEREVKANIIHRAHDKLSGNKPINLISNTNPVVIIDEPQSVDNTENAKKAISYLKPLFIIRYSATHRQLFNLMYRLTPVDAYSDHLVKQIEVSSIVSDVNTSQAFVKLISVSGKPKFSASIEIYKKQKKSATILKEKVVVYPQDDMWEKSNEVDYYKDLNFIVNDIDAFPGNESITFLNGEHLKIGQIIGDVNPEIIKRAQIKETIELHLKKEHNYLFKGIKVLSLFFIDEVAKYRQYDGDQPIKGLYAKWFEEEYTKLINGPYKYLKDLYKDKLSFDPELIHQGYFSIDKNKKFVDSSSGDSASDESAYHLIMVNKERLLSFNEPVRFIFSHSALKEGWDNPNIFQVCTLVETTDQLTKRQKIGRGLRICVDQNLNRVRDMNYNVLSVIANESYRDFAANLQHEFEKDAGYKFGVIEAGSFNGVVTYNKDRKMLELSQIDSELLYKHIKDAGYLSNLGKVNDKFFEDIKNDVLDIPEQFIEFKEPIIERIRKLSREIEIKDANAKIQVKINKEVYMSATFKAFWNRIKNKTVYRVNMDINQFKQRSILAIKEMEEIKPERIYRELAKLDIVNAGVIAEETASYGGGIIISDYETNSLPDLVRRLQDSTNLLRATIAEIIKRSGRLDDFYRNPERFLTTVSRILIETKRENLIKGLEYYKSDEFYIQEEIFDDTAIFGYKDKNILDISDRKNIYDHVIFDSLIEKKFAEDAEADDDVVLYAKLPDKFLIDTPFGGYNPDWIVVIQQNGIDKLYFIAETKGTNHIQELPPQQRNKVLSGRKHFEVLDNQLKYEVVTSLRILKEHLD